MSFSSLDWDIMISSFQKILSSFSNFPPWKTLEVGNWKDGKDSEKESIHKVNIVFQLSPQRKLGSFWNFMWWSITILWTKDPWTNTGVRFPSVRTLDKVLWRYLQNNIDFKNTLIFHVISIFSQFHTSKVFQSGKLLNGDRFFWKLDIKMSQSNEEKDTCSGLYDAS